MAFEVTEKNETTATVTVGERLWLTADRERLVADGDPDAAYLFATPGQAVSRDEAERYRLVKKTRRGR